MIRPGALSFCLAISAVAFVALPMLGGCGAKTPFPLEPVRGTVKYDDGSPIEADQIRIVFNPIDTAARDKVAPRSAAAYADVASGGFDGFTTWKNHDGVLVGRHKVTVIALRLDQRGTTEPTDAIPSRYHRAETTPLEVEVIGGGDNDFNLEIIKGA